MAAMRERSSSGMALRSPPGRQQCWERGLSTFWGAQLLSPSSCMKKNRRKAMSSPYTVPPRPVNSAALAELNLSREAVKVD